MVITTLLAGGSMVMLGAGIWRRLALHPAPLVDRGASGDSRLATLQLKEPMLPPGPDRLTPLEMAVKTLGARYPVLVAARIGADCRDVPAAVAALRQREPHWFDAARCTAVA